MRSVLLVDDEINVLRALQRALRHRFGSAALKVEVFVDPELALLRLGETSFDVIVSDYRMAGLNGIEVLKVAKAIQPDAVRLVLSASTEFDTVIQAINDAEVFRYIAKPWDESDLIDVFASAFGRRDEIERKRRTVEAEHSGREELSPQEREALRLEAEEPGITRVCWGNDGSVHLDDELDR